MKKLTTEEFIEKAQAIHGVGTYGYSAVEYKGGRVPVIIYCNVHKNFFEQKPENHFAGSGCYHCGLANQVGQRTSSTEKFKKRAVEVHGNIYDYCNVKYKTARIKVEIKCKKHGFFQQIPYSHLKGKGCPKCGRDITGKKRRSSKIGFLEKCREVHGDSFDYSMVEFKGTQSKIKIRCLKCGRTFEQHANNHLRGSGCQICSAVIRGEKNRTSTEEFIARAKEKHGSLFDYSDTVYVKSGTKIKYKCEKHGIVNQLPDNHLKYGCRYCAEDSLSLKYRKSTDLFIEECKKAHGEKYQYHLVKYKNNRTKIQIVCPDHGPFWQVAGSHLFGCGCQKCSGNGFDVDKPAILYYLKIVHNLGIFYKIGITNRTVDARFRPADMKNIEVARLWSFKNGGDAFKTEQLILKECAESLAGIDGILLGGGNTEIFKVDIFS